MGNRLAQALKIAVISCLGVAAFGVSGYADEQVTNSGDKSDAARSLEEILKQAGDQGLLKIEGQERAAPKSRAMPARRNAVASSPASSSASTKSRARL